MSNNSLIDSLMENKWCATLIEGGTDKESPHKYISQFYQNFFEVSRPKRILEIGVRYGYSVRLWLSVDSVESIVGLDSDRRIAGPNNSIKDRRYEFFLADAYSKRRRKAVLGRRQFDLVIDDGPHSLLSQMYAAKEFTKFLKPGGALVIEDIQNPDTDVSLIVASLPLLFNGKVGVIDLRIKSGRPDSYIIVVQKCSFQASEDPMELRGVKYLEVRRNLDFIKSRIFLYKWRVSRLLSFLNHLLLLFKNRTHLPQTKNHI